MRDGVKIGVFGLGVELDGLVDKKLCKKTIYQNPIPIANEVAKHLKNEEKCKLIICLSHLGYSYKSNKVSDLILAKSTENIDLIIGGHTHTFLKEQTKVKNLSKKDTLINQVGWAGINLGRLDFYISSDKKNYSVSSQNIRMTNKSF